jgi:hypothetical protein
MLAAEAAAALVMEERLLVAVAVALAVAVAGWQGVDGECGVVSRVSQPPRLPDAGVDVRAARRLATSLAVAAMGLWD